MPLITNTGASPTHDAFLAAGPKAPPAGKPAQGRTRRDGAVGLVPRQRCDSTGHGSGAALGTSSSAGLAAGRAGRRDSDALSGTRGELERSTAVPVGMSGRAAGVAGG